MPYISASGLSYNLPNTKQLFSKLNFSFNKGRTAIIGKNGVGKTTLLRLIQNEILPSTGSLTIHASWEILPQDLSIYENLDLLDVLGVKKIYTAYLQIVEGNYNESNYEILNNRWDIESEIVQSLSRFGFNNIDFNRVFSSFSGGEKVRLLLSKILLKNPDFFLMDEPTNNLDQETKQYIYDFIKEWQKGIILISHDRTLLDLMDHIYDLTTKGIEHYKGNYTFYKQQKDLEYNKLQQDIVSARKDLKKSKIIREDSLNKHTKRANVGNKNRNSISKPAADKWKNSSERKFGTLRRNTANKIKLANDKYKSFLDKTESTLKIKVDLDGDIKHRKKVLIKMDSINYKYNKDNLWDKDLSLLIQGQEKILLKGKNGSGKSTLCKLMTSELIPTKGNIDIHINRISILDQNISCIRNELSLLENIQLFAEPDVPEHKLRIILGGFLFYGEDVFKKASVLSGGEKMRLAMACIFSINDRSELLILDEPTNNMDLESIEQLTQSIKQYPGALILISHDEYFINDVGIDRTISI